MLKKIIGWSLVTAGLVGEYFAVTDMRLDLLHVLIRMSLVFGGVGILAGGIVLIAKSTTTRRQVREYDAQQAYTDELAQRRKTEESWQSIKEAQQK